MQEGSPSLAWRPASFYHVLGDARLRDLNPELEQFAVDTRRTPSSSPTHLPDQFAQFCLDLRSSSLATRFPTPKATKAGPMPSHQRLRLDNRNDLKDQRKPSIHLDEEPTIVVREMSAALQLTPQDHQLMSERGILSLQPDLRLEWRGQDRQDKTQEPDQSASLGNSIRSATRMEFRYTHRSWRFSEVSFSVNVRFARQKRPPNRFAIVRSADQLSCNR